MLQVVEVHIQAAQHLLHRICVSVIEGCVGSNTRANLIQILISRVTFHNLVYVELSFWSWTNKRHVATNHVPELRKFIQMMFSQKLTDMGKPLIFFMGTELRTILFCIHRHASEFIDVEGAPKPSDSFLFENSWSTIFTSYHYIY